MGEMEPGPQEWIHTPGPGPVIGPGQLGPEGGMARAPGPQPGGLPEADEVGVRRTRRTTAGRHPNRYHLPLAVGERGGVSLQKIQCVTGIFRPWD